MPPQNSSLLTAKDLSDLGLSFLLLQRPTSCRHSNWWYVGSWKHSEETGFKTSTNSWACFETLKAVWYQSVLLQGFFSKSWTSLLFSCTFTIIQRMEERNIQQHLNILQPINYEIWFFLLKKKRINTNSSTPQNIYGKKRIFFKIALIYKGVTQYWVLSIWDCSRNISEFSKLIWYLKSGNFDSLFGANHRNFWPSPIKQTVKNWISVGICSVPPYNLLLADRSTRMCDTRNPLFFFIPY